MRRLPGYLVTAGAMYAALWAMGEPPGWRGRLAWAAVWPLCLVAAVGIAAGMIAIPPAGFRRPLILRVACWPLYPVVFVGAMAALLLAGIADRFDQDRP